MKLNKVGSYRLLLILRRSRWIMSSLFIVILVFSPYARFTRDDGVEVRAAEYQILMFVLIVLIIGAFLWSFLLRSELWDYYKHESELPDDYPYGIVEKTWHKIVAKLNAPPKSSQE